MNNISPYTSYVVDIKLPPAIIVSSLTLTLGYVLILLMDYILIRIDTKLPFSPVKLRYIIACYHFILPVVFASKNEFSNITFMLHPWTTAAQIVFLAKSNLTVKEWVYMFFKEATFQDNSPTTDSSTEIRKQGINKLLRGVAKFGFMKIVLDGLLPKDLSTLLNMPFYNPQALFITYILAVRIYCMMGVTDIIMGAIQSLFLLRFKDVFDNPFIASSPKDFWNKRWNRVVNDLFRRFIFSKAIKRDKKKDASKKEKSRFLSQTTLYGLLVFILSGLSHDFMIAVATRTISFELTAFFLIHGIVVALEAKYRTGKFKKDPSGIYYVICNLLTVLFFTTTGRLFLSAILRQEVFLRIAREF